MRWSLLALGLTFGIPALAQEVADTRAAELAKLRREVETMSQELTLANEDLRSQLKAIEAQKVEIEVQIRREELRLAQIDGEAASRKAELEQFNTRGASLIPAVRDSIAKIRGAVESGLPFHRTERLQELDGIESQLEQGAITPEAATARLWAFTEDELRLARENGLDRQVVTVDGAEVLADVARLGMVALYFRTDGGVVGTAVRGSDGTWSWRALEGRDAQKYVGTLFEKLAHGIRSGTFVLPNPGATP
jgi:hypothetical protein